jgi:3-deoxy-manno-octulosonate cytidylyltransferase (CMP-KDO synthetase)
MSDLPEVYAIIPARYQSTRFPGKPLTPILGKPMFWHVYNRAGKCSLLKKLILATDDERIKSAADAHQVPVVMTRSDHPSGTDRVLEAAQKIGVPQEAVVVNIQGDEPLIRPELITSLIAPFSDPGIEVTTPAIRISSEAADNPNTVKVVCDRSQKALYFSRSKVPYDRDQTGQGSYFGHIGLYAFRMKTLKRFVSMPPGTLEQIEKLEQLRLLENGISIYVVETDMVAVGVDTPEDVLKVQKLLLVEESFNGQSK